MPAEPQQPGRKPDQGWTPEEKSQGAPSDIAQGVAGAEGADEAGTAGAAIPAGRPSDDRAATEQAAAEIEKAGRDSEAQPS